MKTRSKKTMPPPKPRKKRPVIGRPRTSGAALTSSVSVRLSEEDAVLIAKAAASRAMSPSSFIREEALRFVGAQIPAASSPRSGSVLGAGVVPVRLTSAQFRALDAARPRDAALSAFVRTAALRAAMR